MLFLRRIFLVCAPTAALWSLAPDVNQAATFDGFFGSTTYGQKLGTAQITYYTFVHGDTSNPSTVAQDHAKTGYLNYTYQNWGDRIGNMGASGHFSSQINVTGDLIDYNDHLEAVVQLGTDVSQSQQTTTGKLSSGATTQAYYTQSYPSVLGVLHMWFPRDMSLVTIWIEAPNYAVAAHTVYWCPPMEFNTNQLAQPLSLLVYQGTSPAVAGQVSGAPDEQFFGSLPGTVGAPGATILLNCGLVTVSGLTKKPSSTSQPSTQPSTQPTDIISATLNELAQHKDDFFGPHHDAPPGENELGPDVSGGLKGFQWRRDVLNQFEAQDDSDPAHGFAYHASNALTYYELNGSFTFKEPVSGVDIDIPMQAMFLQGFQITEQLFGPGRGGTTMVYVRNVLTCFLVIAFLMFYLKLLLWGFGVTHGVETHNGGE